MMSSRVRIMMSRREDSIILKPISIPEAKLKLQNGVCGYPDLVVMDELVSKIDGATSVRSIQWKILVSRTGVQISAIFFFTKK